MTATWRRCAGPRARRSSCRRCSRSAISVIGNLNVATFAAFGSFATLVLVDFSGPMRERLQSQATLALAGGVLVCVGTLASRDPWLAAIAMALVAFCVLFAGVVELGACRRLDVAAAGVHPSAVTAGDGSSSIPDRLAGWGMAAAASLVAIAVLWPAPTRDPLRAPAVAACRALAMRLRSEAAYTLGVGRTRRRPSSMPRRSLRPTPPSARSTACSSRRPTARPV